MSADKLTWTFKLQSGIKYEDGTAVKAEDLAYAIKRSFAHDVYDSTAPRTSSSSSRTATSTRARTRR